MKRLIPLLISSICTLAFGVDSPLPNPGFEEGLAAWVVKDTMSKAVPEAAHSGKLGLRIVDEDKGVGSSVMSAKLPVKAGQQIKVNFWAKTTTSFSSVFLWFYDANRKVIKDPSLKHTDGLSAAAIKETDGEWHPYSVIASAPQDAVTLSLWIHSYSTSVDSVDIDDFEVTGVDPGVKAIIAAPVEPAPPVNLPPRSKPPVIIIKVDDLKQVNGKVPFLWTRFADVIKARNIKASIGIICKTLEEATPEYVGWIKDQQKSGRIEFWFHGYTHDVRTENGKAYGEFVGRDFTEQKRRFDLSQQLCSDKLGFFLQTFGPPGGAVPSFEQTTIDVMAADPHMKVWLYPTPIDASGKKLEAAGKIVILDRVFEVNLESAVGVPSFSRFVSGYAKHPEREYFVLQGHTAQWGTPGKFDEAVKIIDFLIEQHARFATPTEFAEELRARR